MSVKAIPKGKASVTSSTSMIALFQMRHTVVLISIATFRKRLVTNLASEWFQPVCGTYMRRELIRRGEVLGAFLADVRRIVR